ncbi:hypothetical protein KIW84_041426 [Lathyrus oleraceus]|uniref:Uncharacterized protein n=1 Tax=Pisum sativum TaxID=3888 RepID=A0A9D4XBG1_PEA|nr:hypothetical protein KIW84_041426 [Pisum sativum]
MEEEEKSTKNLLRTFLIRNGLSILFKEGPGAYKAYYLNEPFLPHFAKCSPQNQALIGFAGSLVRTEDFLTIVEGGRDEEGPRCIRVRYNNVIGLYVPLV